jgi:hypothetical protein
VDGDEDDVRGARCGNRRLYSARFRVVWISRASGVSLRGSRGPALAFVSRAVFQRAGLPVRPCEIEDEPGWMGSSKVGSTTSNWSPRHHGPC